jgi:hypothetical protein
MLATPDHEAEIVGELAAGDAFALLDTAAGWAWGYREADHLVGYVREEALGASGS